MPNCTRDGLIEKLKYWEQTRGSNPGPLDEKMTRVVARMAETGETPSVKRARARVREALGLSLTDKEIARAIERAVVKET